MAPEHRDGLSLCVLNFIPGETKPCTLHAQSFIRKGTRIVQETPIMSIKREDIDNHVLNLEAIRLLEDGLRFRSLPNTCSGTLPGDLGIVRSHALGFAGHLADVHIGYYCSHIPHSCLNNSQIAYNETTGKLTAHALRDIEPGEEITFFYLSDRDDFNVRKFELFRLYNITCQCPLCTASEDFRLLSDTSLILAKELTEAARYEHNAPEFTLRCIRIILGLYESEGLANIYVANFWMNAFKLIARHGDEVRASFFAKRALDIFVVALGEDHLMTTSTRKLSLNPKGWLEFGTKSLA